MFINILRFELLLQLRRPLRTAQAELELRCRRGSTQVRHAAGQAAVSAQLWQPSPPMRIHSSPPDPPAAFDPSRLRKGGRNVLFRLQSAERRPSKRNPEAERACCRFPSDS